MSAVPLCLLCHCVCCATHRQDGGAGVWGYILQEACQDYWGGLGQERAVYSEALGSDATNNAALLAPLFLESFQLQKHSIKITGN